MSVRQANRTTYLFVMWNITSAALAADVKYDLETPEGSRAYHSDLATQGQNADKLATDYAGNRSAGVPNPGELQSSMRNSLFDYVGNKAQEVLNSVLSPSAEKFQPNTGLVENTLNILEKVENSLILDPVQRKKFESQSEIMADREQMKDEYAIENPRNCRGIPPLTCNWLTANRIECAGGPRVLNSYGIPPWKYTLVARCAGSRFENFDSFDPTARNETVVRPEVTSHGRTYRGKAFSSYCVPCDKSLNFKNQNDVPILRALKKLFD